MSVFFVDDTTHPGDTIHWSGLDPRPRKGHEKAIVTIDLACYSDYSGSAVERSNYRLTLADSGMAQCVVRLFGSHGTCGLAYIPSDPDHPECGHSVPEALRDALSALDNYPVLDDEDEGELEDSLVSEAWADHGLRDFRKLLAAVLDAVDDDGGEEAGFEHEIPSGDSALSSDLKAWIDPGPESSTWGEFCLYLWERGCGELSINGGRGYKIEEGGGVYFYFEEWSRRALDGRPVSTSFRELIRSLAVKCRVTTTDGVTESES